jgi:CheY-like chemotaxis protein
MSVAKSVLLVDDDELDAMITRRSLRELGIGNELIHKTGGDEALEYLQACTSDLPCVILLDLNMPRMSGLEFLRRVKNDASLRSVPVVVVTTSSAAEDMKACFQLGVVECIPKHSCFGVFVESMRRIGRYCLCASAEPIASADAETMPQ